MGNKKSRFRRNDTEEVALQNISTLQNQKTIVDLKNECCIFNEYKIYDYKVNKTGIDEVRPAIHLRSR